MLRKKYYVIFIFYFAMLFTACGSFIFVSKEGEAKKVGEEYWNKLITKCGDDYYTIDVSPICGACPRNNTLTQLKDPKIVTSAENVNEAAKLNGFEMTGNTSVRIKAYRVFFNGKWLEWRQPLGYGLMKMSTSMFKKNGQWYFGSPKYQPHEVDWKQVDCSQVPK